MTFVDDVLSGVAALDDVDRYRDNWETVDSENELHEYLGLEWPEYAMWVENGETLRYVVSARKAEKRLPDFLRGCKGQDSVAEDLWILSLRYILEWRKVGYSHQV